MTEVQLELAQARNKTNEELAREHEFYADDYEKKRRENEAEAQHLVATEGVDFSLVNRQANAEKAKHHTEYATSFEDDRRKIEDRVVNAASEGGEVDELVKLASPDEAVNSDPLQEKAAAKNGMLTHDPDAPDAGKKAVIPLEYRDKENAAFETLNARDRVDLGVAKTFQEKFVGNPLDEHEMQFEDQIEDALLSGSNDWTENQDVNLVAKRNLEKDAETYAENLGVDADAIEAVDDDEKSTKKTTKKSSSK